MRRVYNIVTWNIDVRLRTRRTEHGTLPQFSPFDPSRIMPTSKAFEQFQVPPLSDHAHKGHVAILQHHILVIGLMVTGHNTLTGGGEVPVLSTRRDNEAKNSKPETFDMKDSMWKFSSKRNVEAVLGFFVVAGYMRARRS